jgi:hypothetical protein
LPPSASSRPKSKGAPKAVAKPVPANSPQAAKGAKAAKPEKVDGRGASIGSPDAVTCSEDQKARLEAGFRLFEEKT